MHGGLSSPLDSRKMLAVPTLSLVALKTSVLTFTALAAPVFSVAEVLFCLAARRIDTSLTASWSFWHRELIQNL